ncbi:hypothetical protein JXD38_05800 [candidate division WOR-3 bacterium]|nr:hypothetical protein [candidate division WOR-3 bacterium]
MARNFGPFSIVDPLYELGAFKTGAAPAAIDNFLGCRDEVVEVCEELVNTFELNRQNFLKQSGLLYLMFPSSTHTRFAHSVGTMILGYYALDHVRVKYSTRHSNTKPLRHYAAKREMTEAFLVSLLTHDAGHLPFSHTLEDCPPVAARYGDHEEITADYLTTSSPLYKSLAKRARTQHLDTMASVCRHRVQLSKVRGLHDKRNTSPISQLVNGYIDLDRLDHYYRDSFFIGLKLASVNIKGFLEAVVVDAASDRPLIKLRREGIQHVLNLLFGREMLWQGAFDTDTNRAYTAMFNASVAEWLRSEPDRLSDLPFMTEEALLAAVFSNRASLPLAELVFTRRPYQVAFKAELHSLSRASVVEMFLDWVKGEALANDQADYLLFVPRKFGSKQAAATEWLSGDIPIIDDGASPQMSRQPGGGSRALLLRNAHQDLFDYFGRQNHRREMTIRVFARDQKLATAAAESLEVKYADYTVR